jgi:hypothetical protein
MSLVAPGRLVSAAGPGLREAFRVRHQGCFRNHPADAQIGFLGWNTTGDLSMEGWNLA